MPGYIVLVHLAALSPNAGVSIYKLQKVHPSP